MGCDNFSVLLTTTHNLHIMSWCFYQNKQLLQGVESQKGQLFAQGSTIDCSLSTCTNPTSGVAKAGPGRAAIFFFGAQFSRKLARLYEYSYLGPVLYTNIHIAHDTKVFVTLREKKKKAMKYPFPVPSPNPNPNCNTKSKPLHHKQLRKTMHTILPNVYRAYLVPV